MYRGDDRHQICTQTYGSLGSFVDRGGKRKIKIPDGLHLGPDYFLEFLY